MGSQDLVSDMGSLRGPRPQGYLVGCGMWDVGWSNGIYPLVKLTWLAGK